MAPAGFTTPDGVTHVKGRSREAARAFIEKAQELGIDPAKVVTTSVGYLVPNELLASDAPAPEEDQEQEQETADEDLQAFDPSDHTVDQVVEYLSGADDTERQRVLDAEAEGKARKGITDLNTTGKDAE